jgi:hypothetical protein
MVVDPLRALLRSRKFVVAMCDLVVALVLYFGGKYVAPAHPGIMEDVKFLIGVLQVPVGLVIAAIAYEDAAKG